MWPHAEKAREYVRVQWDAKRDSMMEGEENNAYDIESSGSNSMTRTLELAALQAGEIMLGVLRDRAAAD